MTIDLSDAAPPLAHRAPASFRRHVLREEYRVAVARERAWAWLDDPATFTDSQVWPWRVEFVGGAMETGVQHAHYGPLVHFVGVVGERRAPAYRELLYGYGSYAVSMRLARPTSLRFWLEELGPQSTALSVELESFVRPWFYGTWERTQRMFWRRFPRWMERELKES